MINWQECKLGDVVKTNAKSIDKSYSFEKILYLDTGSITKGKIESFQVITLKDSPSRAKRLVKPNDIVYSTVRPIQRHYGILKKPQPNLVVSTGFTVIEVNQKLADPDFIYFHLSSDESVEYLDVIAEASTSTYPSLKPSDIENLDISLPPLQEQKAIASVLSSLDDKIDLLHRQNNTLERMAETLFRQWFIEEAQEDWEEGTLKDEFDFTMGQSPSGTSFNEEGIGIPMFQGNADFGFRFPTERVYTTEPSRFAEPMDTIISVRAPVGAQNMAKVKCCIGRGVAAFRYKKNANFYTYTYFKLRSLMEEIKQFNDEGTVFGAISKSDFENLATTIPNDKDVITFENEVKPINDKIIKNCEQIQTLEKLRDNLLPKLMSGEVRVKI